MKTINNLTVKLSPTFKNVLTLDGLEKDEVIFERIERVTARIFDEQKVNIKTINIEYDDTLDSYNYKMFLDQQEVLNNFIKSDYLIAVYNEDFDYIPSGERFKEPVFGLGSVYIKNSQKRESLDNGCTILSAEQIISTDLEEYIGTRWNK